MFCGPKNHESLPHTGLGVTEPPHIAADDPTQLAEGMVVTIEPAIERRDGLYCAECLFAVTPSGGCRLNSAGSSLVAVGPVPR